MKKSVCCLKLRCRSPPFLMLLKDTLEIRKGDLKNGT